MGCYYLFQTNTNLMQQQYVFIYLSIVKAIVEQMDPVRKICPMGSPNGTKGMKKSWQQDELRTGMAKNKTEMTKQRRSQMARKIIREWKVTWTRCLASMIIAKALMMIPNAATINPMIPSVQNLNLKLTIFCLANLLCFVLCLIYSGKQSRYVIGNYLQFWPLNGALLFNFFVKESRIFKTQTSIY